mgnify:CR=1 FL=1
MVDAITSKDIAAKDIEDLLRYEQQITQREAELQSLKAQQSYLADQTSMSTVTVYLSTPKAYVEPPGTLRSKSRWVERGGMVVRF